MKTTIISLVILLSAVSYAIYSYQTPPTTAVVMLKDITDKMLANVDQRTIMKLYNLTGDNIYNGATFSVTNISDVTFNKVCQIALPPANKWFSNELSREQDIDAFDNDIAKAIKDTDTGSIGRPYSSVYMPIANALNLLSQSKSQKRIAIINSDLMQNDFDGSFYNKKEFALLQTNPDSLKDLFEQEQPLPSLTGITIYLIYQPANSVADEQFRVVSAFYKSMLEEKGATVIIGANI